MTQKIKIILKSFFVLTAFALSVQAFAAWTSPMSSPLVSNIEAPINVGNLLQYKVGSLVAGGFRSTSFGLFDGQVRVGTAGVNPSSSAILDLVSTNQGLLAPRMTTTQRNAITSPADGLLVFNTTTDGLEYYKNSTSAWTPVTPVVGASGWSLTGNAGTTSANFIGTTDNTPLIFKVNNQLSGKIDSVLQNSFYGYQAGIVNTTGADNTAVGMAALYSNTTGGANTAVGQQSLIFNTIGAGNTGVGASSLKFDTTGSNNTASGGNALYSNTAGNFNTAIGTNALYFNTTGSNNIGIGYKADVVTGALTNATAIGYNAKVGASNSLVLGGTGVNAVNVGIGTATPNASSILDLTSTAKALTLPRMTKAQRDAIVSPIAGMIIYQIDNIPGLRTFSGVSWMRYTETAD